MKLTQAILAAAATELNDVLGLDPAINTTLSRTELKNKVREASELVEPSDTLSKETAAVINSFKGDDEPAETGPRRQRQQAKAKDDERGTSKKNQTTPTSTSKKQYTKAHALKDALQNGGGTRQDLAAKLDENYVKQGGKSSPTGSKAMVDIHLPVLAVFGVVEKDGDKFRLRK